MNLGRNGESQRLKIWKEKARSKKYAISNISDILRKRSLRKWGKSLHNSFYLHRLKYFTYLTSAVITNKPFSAITIVPAGITEVHHAGSPVLAWYSIAHVRASKRWSQSVYVVGLGCTHPSLALVWGGFSIGFIIFN